MELKNFLPQRPAQDSRKGPLSENDRRPRRSPGGPNLLGNRRSWPATPVVQGARTLSTPRTTGATADGQKVSTTRALSGKLEVEKSTPLQQDGLI